MKQLIIVRHGHYSRDPALNADSLTEAGQSAMTALCQRLAPIVGETFLHILTATDRPSMQSTDVIARRFGALISRQKELLCDRDHPENLDVVLDLIRNYDEPAEILVLVTSFRYARDFPRHYGRAELKITVPDAKTIDKAEAVVIDCDKKTVSYV